MTVQTTASRADYTGNGTTTSFTVPFYFLDNTHITVLRTQISTGVITTLALTTDYTVSGAGVGTGGTITCVTAPTTGQKISILRNVPLTQLSHYVPNDPFPAATHEQIVDQLTMEVQQVNEIASRALQLAPNTSTAGVSTSLPTPSANKLIGWNSSASGLQNLDAGTLATVVAFGTANADNFSGDGSTVNFTLSANPGALNNLDVAIGGVSQRPSIDYTWVSGTTLTFTSAPPAGTNNILVRYMQGLPQGYTDSANSTFLQSGTGAVTRTVQTKLREYWVSVTDFGADPTGINDSTSAIQAAMDAIAVTGGTLYIPPGTYLIGAGAINAETTTTSIRVLAYGATLQRMPTTNSYTMFRYRRNMVIEGLKLKGYIASGTGWADVVPANSFGFRSSDTQGANGVLFIGCEAESLPYDGFYNGATDGVITLVNCSGNGSYRNDFAAVEGRSIVIQGGNWGYNNPVVSKVAAIDIEPGSGVDYVSITSLKTYNKIDFWSANGNIRHAIINGVTFDGSVSALSWYRVRQMNVGEVKFLNGANFYRPGVPDVQSGVQYLPNGSFQRLGNIQARGQNLLVNPYNSVEGFTNSNSGTITTVPNYKIADKRGIQITNTGGGYNIFYQTVTVTPEEFYTLGGVMQYNSGSGGQSGLYISMPTLGFAEVYLQTNEDAIGIPQFLCAAIKIPTGVTSIRVGFGTSGGTRDQAFTSLFFCKGIVGEGAVSVPMITYANAAPTTGTWAVGDRVVRATPVVGQPKAWVCTVAGTPGTWTSEGNL